MSTIHTGIITGPLQQPYLLGTQLTAAEHGALCSFIGVVRNEHHGKTVTHLIYDCYQDMAEKMLKDLCLEMQDRHGEELALACYHGTGHMEIGDASVAIHVASGHRPGAFAACRDLLERLKEDLPVWKEEFYADGSSEWLQGS